MYPTILSDLQAFSSHHQCTRHSHCSDLSFSLHPSFSLTRNYTLRPLGQEDCAGWGPSCGAGNLFNGGTCKHIQHYKTLKCRLLLWAALLLRLGEVPWAATTASIAAALPAPGCITVTLLACTVVRRTAAANQMPRAALVPSLWAVGCDIRVGPLLFIGSND